MKHESSDLRVRRTLKCIRDAFYELIMEKDFIIDRESGDYHYEVSIDGINESEIAKKILSNYAWTLNENNKLIINL